MLKEIDITKIVDRDSQEVVGYFETLDLISESYEEIEITESSLKNLHNILLKYSKKDEWHKGDYKQHSNAVEAKLSRWNKTNNISNNRSRISNTRCNENFN